MSGDKDLTSQNGGKDKKKKKEKIPMASVGEVFSFMWALGPMSRLMFLVGCIAAVANGAVYPGLAYLFSNSFSDIAGAADGLANIRELSFTFLIVGVYALVAATLQTGMLEIVAARSTRSFRLQWFNALLRQDSAFYDVYDVSGMAASIQPNSTKFARGTGRKLGEGIQFFTTFVGGIGYAFYSSWKVALVIMAVLPFVSLAAIGVMSINQTKGSRASASYSKASSISYAAVASIKTVLSLNAVPEFIKEYKDATLEAYKQSVAPLLKQGFAFGSMLGSFICLYCILTLYGAYLIYKDVRAEGCDPAASKFGTPCENSGPAVFGAMLGVAFAAQGISQVGNFFETFTTARVAAYPAMQAMRRKVGSPQEKIFVDETEDDELKNTTHSIVDKETGRKVKAILPKYAIDARSTEGKKPTNIRGQLEFKNVSFTYPTRPDSTILDGLNLVVEEGKTTALVGPSGGGKSTTVAMIERFYDPLEGSVTLDGVDIKEINVSHLRSLIGYVGQEPTLFATSIAGNIGYGRPGASHEEVEAAARAANAHDFITSFPDGYDTQVGDKGAQLSGGQKQRIAIARVLVANPSILLLDEATSALDSESELVVQDALDNVVANTKRTTIVIAHRLSTIRQADSIAVIAGGKVVEQGTHDELIANEGGHYWRLVEKQDRRNTSASGSRSNSYGDLKELDEDDVKAKILAADLEMGTPHFEFRDASFAYPTRPNKKIFDGFNLKIKSGETVALVGPSGGGKSTAVAMIERFYDTSSGSMNYKGFDVKSLNLQWYRDQIGYVGQEPTLFDQSIADNIRYGKPDATQEEIEEAAKKANIHDTIMAFPQGYETEVGQTAQLSGGQKQRVAIARALVKSPKVLLLDEATSALDTESEAVVQEALDKLMASKDHTTIVIAHRLSTIQGVDRIAFIANGKVLEYGSHQELLALNGRYRRLVDTQNRAASVNADMLRKAAKKTSDEEEEDDKPDFEAVIAEKEKNAFSIKRAREMAGPDSTYMLLGSIGAVFAGGVFPAWGILFAQTIDLLFRVVPTCDDAAPTENYASCQAYSNFVADDMRQSSFELAAYWAIVAFGCIAGNMLTLWGFGMASERLNKRVRDSSFSALVRQEVAFFDMRSVGSITSQLQDDAARIHTFSGEPIRTFIIAFSSIVTGVVVSFIFMWPFALLALGCIPLMGFATSIEMKQMLGEDEGDDNAPDQDQLNSPGGIVVETLLNIRTVAALTLEEERAKDFENAIEMSQPHYVRAGFMSGAAGGASMFIQQWVNALQFWFGGWLLFNFPDQYEFNDFLISMFAILFSLFGLGAAFNGLSDRKETEASAGRIFYLLDRVSAIDPLSEEGKKPDDVYAGEVSVDKVSANKFSTDKFSDDSFTPGKEYAA